MASPCLWDRSRYPKGPDATRWPLKVVSRNSGVGLPGGGKGDIATHPQNLKKDVLNDPWGTYNY